MVMNEDPTVNQNKPLRQVIWDFLTEPSVTVEDIGERRSARLAASFLITVAFFAFMGGTARFAMAQQSLIQAFSGGIGFTLFPTLVAYALARTKWYRFAIFIFSVIYSAIAYNSMISEGTEANSGLLILIYVPISLIVASSFLSTWAVFLLVGLNVGALIATRFFGAPIPSEVAVEAAIITVTGLVLILLTNFRNNIEKVRLDQVQQANRELENLTANLEQRVDERTMELETVNKHTARRAALLQAITELSEAIAELQDPNEIFPATAKLIHERFGFYHVGIFLTDQDREYAILQAANSEGGKRMLERAHRLKLGTGVVGYCAQTGEPRIALDVGTDAVFFDNPDLPETRSEVALPLNSRYETGTVGVLDVQSKEAGAFSTEDLQVLTALANQVSIAIENARLLSEARTALAQVQEVYNEFTRSEWSRTISKVEQKGFRYQTGRIEMLENNLQESEVTTAIQSGGISTNHEKNTAVAVPVKLRGEVIGILHIASNNPARGWQPDEISLVEAVAERAAFAMENARLFQDARKRAAKERLISEATAKISGALNIENILQTTADELERVLGGSEVLIQFQNKEQA